MASKRKLVVTAQYSDSAGTKANQRSAGSTPVKKVKREGSLERAKVSSASPIPESDVSHIEEQVGIVQRRFYPAEMPNERCAQYNNNEIPRPIEVLESALKDTLSQRNKLPAGRAVLHWFKRDLRLSDNRGLSAAADEAKQAGLPLICLFVISPEDYEAHLTAPSRVDFELRTLQILQNDLAELDIPLIVFSKADRTAVPQAIVDMCKEHGVRKVFCNIEYEVDELRREAKLVRLCLENGISFNAVHDDCIVPPGQLKTGQGRQYAVYSPWFRTWIAHLHAHPSLLAPSDKPGPNPPTTRKTLGKLFDCIIPATPENKKLDPEDKARFEHLWPAGEHEALLRVDKFLKEKARRYKDMRNLPSANSTAIISVHHSAGTLAARTSVRLAREMSGVQKLDGGNPGIAGWISEIAWRDFYKHVLVHWPYICMNKPFKFEYSNITWEYSQDLFDAWCQGRTGFPIVDAAMRQMREMSYVHNRCRMIAASFLAKDLLLDWRMGERFFMENLIDGDFACNNGGWGFSASTGVDPQPYFRIFNPTLQSEKFDPDGEYIRRWVPELRQVKGKAIHDPYARGQGDLARRGGYPKPVVNHKEARDRALTRYKAGIGRSTA